MIVFRCYDVLGWSAIQVERHGNCCGTGTCHEPDQRQYTNACGTSRTALTEREQLVDMVHEYLSALDEDDFIRAMVDHLTARRTR
jgi:hypothetical protein